MSIFDRLKQSAVDAAATAATAIGNKRETFTFAALPESLAQLQALPEAALDTPFQTAALTVLALCAYAADRQIGTDTSDFGFTAIEISPAVSLAEGDNVITFEIFNSDKATGTFNAVGCLFDCIEFTGYSGEIGWRPKVANVAGL